MPPQEDFIEYQEELESVYSRAAWIVELEASRRDLDPLNNGEADSGYGDSQPIRPCCRGAGPPFWEANLQRRRPDLS